MRWDHLFDDLAGQLEHELQSEESDLRLEEERLRLGRLPLRERLAVLKASADPALSRVRLRVRSGETHDVRLVTVGRDWLAGDIDGGAGASQAIFPLAAVDSLVLTQQQADVSLDPLVATSELAARLGVAFLLRDLCRRRAAVIVVTAAGSATGTIDRVGRDHLDLAVHDLDAPRRTSAVEHVRVVAFDQLLLVRL
ncbi:hypothetical protein [Microcella sp.]|uniref:hypothetical protein n=1 Tax=Microcella sp. TaxID=1913979 RepID=UPI002566338D|nr:hypothetical protein [Microcella sp.]MBX9472780.1 hypothetical protein [Microcella sp.]